MRPVYSLSGIISETVMNMPFFSTITPDPTGRFVYLEYKITTEFRFFS